MVCLDETNRQLIEEKHPPIQALEGLGRAAIEGSMIFSFHLSEKDFLS